MISTGLIRCDSRRLASKACMSTPIVSWKQLLSCLKIKNCAMITWDFHSVFGLLMAHLWFTYTAWKLSKYEVFSGSYFPVFGLNTEIYRVNLCIQSEYGKIRTRKTPHLDIFYAVLGELLQSGKVKQFN